MSKPTSALLLTSGFLGLSGVMLGALGAHVLQAALAARLSLETWHTAVLYHLMHAVAILAVALAAAQQTAPAARWLRAAAWCWAGGIVLFSGSLYGLALGGYPPLLGPVTPLGGLAFLAGWVCVIVGGWKSRRSPPA